ncbi:MAG: 3-phosphoglycerate dehydrogenase [Cytophagaceae bacterium]|jgi:D-3-phosphoglycerate dehydrogenase|nr:3-phosphoglycerate dehydrogenase [Cytophagaceae bacterium]
MKKVLVATEKPFTKVAVDGIRKIVEDAGYKLELLEKYTSEGDLLNAVADADGMIVRSDIVNQNVVSAAKNLKIVVRAGAGYDNLDLKACSNSNIVAMNTPGQNSNAVAELAFGMMVYGIRKQFSGADGTELRGKCIGIHAYGNVGYYVAQIAHGFGMKVYAFDPFVSAEKMRADNVEPLATVEELYKTCQFVSLHIPATDATKKSINKKLLSLMPAGAVLVNTARKEVVNEDELVELMEERKDLMYLSDIKPANEAVFVEKFAGRFFFTPKKMGAQTAEANINAGVAAASQIVDFFTTGNEKFRVNK